jgi:hypothetical protein
MPEVYRRGTYFVIGYVTGPRWLTLMLDLQSERIADPYVTPIEQDGQRLYPAPTDEVVRAAVLRGTDRANKEFGTVWHPLEIRYRYSGWDYERCGLMESGAYEIVAVLSKRGPDGVKSIDTPLL